MMRAPRAKMNSCLPNAHIPRNAILQPTLHRFCPARHPAACCGALGLPLVDGQKFYDPKYSSCSKLIYDISRERFGLGDSPDIVELVRWADIIDAARFPNAEMAVLRAEPALWLMTVVENHGDDAFLSRVVPRLLAEPLEDIARSPEIQV